MTEHDESGAAADNGGPAVPDLAALAARWRETARMIDDGTFGDDEYNAGETMALRMCADELEALTGGAAPAPNTGASVTPAEFDAFTRKHSVRWEEL